MERDASLDDFLDGASDEDDEAEETSATHDDVDSAPEAAEVDDSAEDSGSEDSADDSESEETADGSGPADSGPEETTVEPARSTGRWDAEGGACDACGASVTRRWREAAEAVETDSFVCVECKSW